MTRMTVFPSCSQDSAGFAARVRRRSVAGGYRASAELLDIEGLTPFLSFCRAGRQRIALEIFPVFGLDVDRDRRQHPRHGVVVPDGDDQVDQMLARETRGERGLFQLRQARHGAAPYSL
jgi:hypothetical protein